MTEPNCAICGCEAHWHAKYGGGAQLGEWKPQRGKRGRCSAFLPQRNGHGFKIRCDCKAYRVGRAA